LNLDTDNIIAVSLR